MERFIDDVRVAVAVTVDDQLVYGNAAFRELAGVAAGPWTAIFAAPDHPTIASALAAALLGQPRRHQVTCNGRAVEVAFSATTHDGRGAVALALADISMRVVLAERLMESEARFHRLVSGVADPIVAADARGRIVLWNDAASRAFGYSELDALGEPFAMLFPPELAADYAPERFAIHDVPGLGRTTQSRARRRDGSEFPTQMAFASSDFGGARWFTAVIHDDSERQQLIDSLARSEASFRTLVEQSPDPIFVSGAAADDFELRYVNDAMVALLGYTSMADLVGRCPIDTFVHPDDRATLIDHRRRREAGEDLPPAAIRWIRRDGAVLDIRALFRPVRFADRPASLVFARDVTHALRLEEQLRQTQKMDAVGQLAGGIAHDFNNILAVILANASLAIEDLGDHRATAELLEIEGAARRAAALTRQLLAFSRKARREPKPIVLDAVVTNLEKMLSRIVGEDIALCARLDGGLATIEADTGQIEQVLMNLVVNARDAMPGGGRVQIETASTTLEDTEAAALGVARGRYVALTVADDGCGMDAGVRARIFEPFFTTKEVGKGTGLGLSTVFGIVKQSGGAIAVTSRLGEGTTFRLYFPRIDAAAATAPCGPRYVPPRGSGTVLLVEDDTQVRAVLRRHLVSWGYRLLEASNGATALAVARAHTGAIDLLLTDLVMPEMDGLALSERLLAERPATRVVFMSGYTEHPALRNLALGAEHFMAKPFTTQVLSETVRRVFGEV